MFIETKLWISDYGYGEALHGFDKAAGKLGVEQIDLLLLHQPLPTDFAKTIGAYRALETLLADGKVRAIGVSNVQAADAAHGVVTQAWSPLGGITSYRGDAERSTFTDPVVGGIAQAHGKSPAQVMLRWHLLCLPAHTSAQDPSRRARAVVRRRAQKTQPRSITGGRSSVLSAVVCGAKVPSAAGTYWVRPTPESAMPQRSSSVAMICLLITASSESGRLRCARTPRFTCPRPASP